MGALDWFRRDRQEQQQESHPQSQQAQKRDAQRQAQRARTGEAQQAAEAKAGRVNRLLEKGTQHRGETPAHAIGSMPQEPLKEQGQRLHAQGAVHDKGFHTYNGAITSPSPTPQQASQTGAGPAQGRTPTQTPSR